MKSFHHSEGRMFLKHYHVPQKRQGKFYQASFQCSIRCSVSWDSVKQLTFKIFSQFWKVCFYQCCCDLVTSLHFFCMALSLTVIACQGKYRYYLFLLEITIFFPGCMPQFHQDVAELTQSFKFSQLFYKLNIAALKVTYYQIIIIINRQIVVLRQS